MTIAVGDRLPAANLSGMRPDGPEQVALGDKLKGRTVVIFAVPGAYTPTCHSAHVPSFIRVHDDLRAKGVDEVICVAVNDAFVLDAWGRDTGASQAGITMLGDPAAEFTEAIGMRFDAPPAGLIARSKRYSMLVVDGVVKVLNVEDSPGECSISAGETMLDAL